VTLGGVENSDFIFTPVVSDVYLRLSPEGSAGHQVTKMCSGYSLLTSELDCLD
jgi:hypothetical protein